MDNIPAEAVQAVDNEADEVTTYCLGNAVVLRNLFQYFSNEELLLLSCVNKFWNYESRSEMRKRGNLMAYLAIGHKDLAYANLEAFGADLRQMNVVPFSGISLLINLNGLTCRSAALNSTYEAILARLELKYLEVLVDGILENPKYCATSLLLKKLFQTFSGHLKELTLYIEEKRNTFIQHFVRDCIFTDLKVLKLEEDLYTFGESYTSYLRALIGRAPKLQEVYTAGPINLKQNVMEGSSGVLMAQHEVCAPFDEISESVIHKIRLKDMKLFYSGPEFNLDRFNRITPMLLLASCTKTVRTVWMDPVLAVPLMSYGIPLENVSRFVMALNCNHLELFQPHILRILKNFDFARIFPNLVTVEIYDSVDYFEPSPDHMNTIIQQANTVLREPLLPDRAANVKELDFRKSSICSSALQFFAEMFPDIQKLEIEVAEEEKIPFGSIWKHWTNLKELNVRGQFLPNTENLDSIFCGIFPEEVAQLREKDEEYLKRVNIVPVMPAITSLKNLKMFDLYLHRYGQNDEPFVDHSFSKVTRLIAFTRCPSLAIKLEIFTG